MANPELSLEKGQNETDIEYANRMRIVAENAERQLGNAEIVANTARDNAAEARTAMRNAFLIAGVAILAAITVLGFLLFGYHNDPKLVTENTSLKIDNGILRNKVSDLEKRKPPEIVQGMTPEQCMVLVDKAVDKACPAKSTPVATAAKGKKHGGGHHRSGTATTAFAKATGNGTATATAIGPHANATASAGVPAPAQQPSVVSGPATNVPGYEICRLRSDGTARLLTDPKAKLPRGYVIATDLPDPQSPAAKVISKPSGENCDQWRARITSSLVDLTSGPNSK